ncbi:MAG: hypothetical protein K0Q73_8297 [Paenibacillus sp.]|jgi:hypothetical protein|nr:hypothetical protein [Paenibacillus sp.]
MVSSKKLNQFTLEDVIHRKIQFTNTNTIFNKTDFKNDNEGALLAYSEMLADVKKEMEEDEFVGKYLRIIKNLGVQFENKEFTDENELERMSGYNNAIVSILKCIDPIHEFDLEDNT